MGIPVPPSAATERRRGGNGARWAGLGRYGSDTPTFVRCGTLELVSFGQFTKQLAKEALGNQVKDVMDSLRPPDAAARAEALGNVAAPAASPGDNLSSVVIAQVQAMQNGLKEDQELVVLCTVGLETLRVLEMFAPSKRVLVLTGIDSDRAVTRVISAVESLQLVCKTMAVQAQTKPARVRFILPKG